MMTGTNGDWEKMFSFTFFMFENPLTHFALSQRVHGKSNQSVPCLYTAICKKKERWRKVNCFQRSLRNVSGKGERIRESMTLTQFVSPMFVLPVKMRWKIWWRTAAEFSCHKSRLQWFHHCLHAQIYISHFFSFHFYVFFIFQF